MVIKVKDTPQQCWGPRQWFMWFKTDTIALTITVSVRIPSQCEDEPIGWFELEDDWNDVEIKLQQCRVAKVHTTSCSH